jgi:hypothetical protein
MSAPKQNILWQPAPGVQTEWLRCSAFEKLMAGGAGAGKSSCLLSAAAAESSSPAMRSLILRVSYPMLKDLIAASHLIYAPMRARYNVTLHQWTFPSGAIIEFGAIENTEAAIMNYSGRSFSFIGVDEVVQLAGDGVDATGQPINGAYSFLKSRLRAVEGSGLSLQLASTGTPGGVGQAWIRSYFGIKESGESCETRDPITGTRRAYFRCTVEDNPVLRNTGYSARLQGLPEAQRRALAEGDWNSYVGQVFAEYSYALHTCPPIDPERIPENWEMWRGADDGFAAPACVLWFAHDPVYDRIYITDELYASGMTPRDMATAVLEIDSRYGRELDGVIDSASFADIGADIGSNGRGGGRADVMNAYGCRWKPSPKGAGSRVAGVSAIHSRLASKADGRPGLIIGRNCQHTVRTLPQMVYDRTHPEDIDPGCEEHCVKAAMYALTRRVVKCERVRVRGI